MEFLIIGIVTSCNVIFILHKWKLKRYSDAILDFIILAVIAILFSGSYGALVIGTVSSFIISIYLYANPPSISSVPINIDTEDLKRRFSRRYR